MNQQLPLGLRLPNTTRLSDFIAGNNQELLALLQAQRDSNQQAIIYLTGEPHSGRTHLLMGQCQQAQTQGMQTAYLPCSELLNLSPTVLEGLAKFQLLAIDDVEQLAGHSAWEEALFYLFNQAQEHGCRLLFSAQQAAQHSGFTLADLSSRLGWGITYRLKPLDDPQRAQLLINLAARHGLQMPAEVAHYVIRHEARDIPHLTALVAQLDHASLAAQRRLTLPFVRDQLQTSSATFSS